MDATTLNAEELLEELLTKCFYIRPNGDIEWNFAEDVELAEEEPELKEKLINYIKEKGLKL